MRTATNILTIVKDKNADPSQDMKLHKTRTNTQFFTFDILLLDSAFAEIPQCPARDPPPV